MAAIVSARALLGGFLETRVGTGGENTLEIHSSSGFSPYPSPYSQLEKPLPHSKEDAELLHPGEWRAANLAAILRQSAMPGKPPFSPWTSMTVRAPRVSRAPLLSFPRTNWTICAI